MIFIVVGSQEPFDRLIKAVDLWASENKHKNVFAQIGKTNLRPRHINWTEFLPPQVFEEKLKQAQIIISHAGRGTILNALYHSKPIIVMPRLFHFHEQRNDHQLATARSLSRLGITPGGLLLPKPGGCVCVLGIQRMTRSCVTPLFA